jgi:hypothetical protein
LRSSLAQLEDLAPAPRLGPVSDARAGTLEAGASALATVDRGRDALRVLGPILGLEGRRQFLLLVQNSAELRGTGGLIGFLAVLTAEDGEVRVSEPEGVDAEAVLTGAELVVRSRFLESERLDRPVARPDDFAARYDSIAAGSFLASTNADPDLPTVAPIILELYDDRAGEQLDGVIAIDPLALQRIQQTLGALELPREIAALAPELGNPIESRRLAQLLLVDVYNVLGGDTEERRLYQAAVAAVALRGVLSGGWDAIALATAVGEAGTERHLQIFSAVAEEQEAIERLGIGGSLEPLAASDDFVAVTANNASAGKRDVHVSHAFDHDIRLAEPRLLDGEVRVHRELVSRTEVQNDIDVEENDPYITDTFVPQRVGEPGVRDGRPGLTRTWFTNWLSDRAELEAVTDDNSSPLPFSSDDISDRLAVDHYLEVMPGGTESFIVHSHEHVPVAWDGTHLTYGLTIWRQAKGIPDGLDVTVRPPGGWRVVDTELHGGGQPGGIGPGAPGSPLEVSVEDGNVRLRGSATADTRLVVRLAPANG